MRSSSSSGLWYRPSSLRVQTPFSIMAGSHSPLPQSGMYPAPQKFRLLLPTIISKSSTLTVICSQIAFSTVGRRRQGMRFSFSWKQRVVIMALSESLWITRSRIN